MAVEWVRTRDIFPALDGPQPDFTALDDQIGSGSGLLGPPTWSDERISLRPLPRIFVEASLKSLKR